MAAPQLYAIQALADHPFFGRLFRACSALSDDFPGVYLVGGFVRDLLLDQPNADVDIAVEGDGIEFATRLANELGGRVRAHRKFKTAVVLLPPDVLGEAPAWVRTCGEPFHVDVATTRTEFYDYPAALPRVEHASIRQDLFRRDFTINAMAISLSGADFGTVIDFFGGYRDLRDGVIRVLHNLSFIEDPTRIFRAVRYENRYGFRMDEQTHGFARSCVDMHLVGDLSSVRLRDELVALLSEGDVRVDAGTPVRTGSGPGSPPQAGHRGQDRGSRAAAGCAGGVNWDCHDEVVPWRLRLAAVTRNMTHDELYVWLERSQAAEGRQQLGDGGGGRGAASGVAAGEAGDARLGYLPGAAEHPAGSRLVRAGRHGAGSGGDPSAALSGRYPAQDAEREGRGPPRDGNETRAGRRPDPPETAGVACGRHDQRTDRRARRGPAHGGEERMNIDWIDFCDSGPDPRSSR